MVVLLDEFQRIYLYPDTPVIEEAFRAISSKLYLPLRTGAPGQRSFTGHNVMSDAGAHNRARALPTWSTALAPGEDIVSVIHRPTGPIASLGRVLGNRTTLYKYLNPHLFAVTSTSPDACSIRVLDGVKGSILYHATWKAQMCNVQASFAENWLIYVYWEEQYQWVGQSKGRRVVTVEFYEGNGPDDKTSRWAPGYKRRYADTNFFNNLAWICLPIQIEPWTQACTNKPSYSPTE